MSAEPLQTADVIGLTKVAPFSRRGFMTASAAVTAGYTLAAGPVRADAIKTDTGGLTAGDAKITVADGEMLVHLARPNPVWPHLEATAEVRLAVIGDYAYIPTYWRAKAGGPDKDGVPTSYYATVQFVCRPTIVDDPEGKIEILTAQLGDFQPEGGHATVAVGEAPYGRMLRGIRGVRLAVLRVDALLIAPWIGRTLRIGPQAGDRRLSVDTCHTVVGRRAGAMLQV